MKLRFGLSVIVLALVLCCTLQGCKNQNDEEVKTEKEAVSNSAVTEISKSLSWELVKEVDPGEKGFQSRFTGFFNDSFGISTYQFGVLHYTVDGGETWTPGTNKSDCIAGLEIIDENNAYIAANYSEVRASVDGGASWEELPKFGDMKNEHCRYLSFIDRNTGWIANRKEIGYTTDGGQLWKSLEVPQSLSDISAIWLSSKTEGYLLSTEGKLYQTLDEGIVWTEKDLGIKGLKLLVCPTVELHVDDPQTFQIVAFLENEEDKGYYYLSTVDGGDSWVKNELIVEGGPGFIYLNREGTLLTLSDAKDKTIKVFQFIQ